MADYDAKVRVIADVETAQMQKLQIQVDKATHKVSVLAKELEELKNKKIPTTEYVELEKKLKAAQADLQRLNEQKKEYASLGFGEAELAGVNRQISDAKSKIEQIIASMQKMTAEGKAFTLGASQDEITEKARQLSLAQAEQRAAITRQQEAYEKMSKSAKKCFKVLHTDTKKSSGLFSQMASRLKGIALSLLVFNWITKGFNAMVSAMKEGFQNLAQYSDDYNDAMSELKSQAVQLKNGLAVAFEPVANVIIPYLAQMVSWLNTAAEAVAQFFAVLQGKNTYTRAKKQVIDYRKSLDAASKSAKRALASFDELNVISEQGSAGGSGEKTGPNPFEDVAIDDSAAKAFQAAVERARKLLDSLKKLMDDLKKGDFLAAGKDISDIISEFLDLLTDGINDIDWEAVGEDIGDLLKGIEWTQILKSAGNFFEALVDAAIDLWCGSFSTAPFETGLATALALISWGGLPGIEVCGASLGKAIAAAAVAAFVGYQIGEKIAETIDPESFNFYEEVKGSEGGIWGYLTSDLESSLDGLLALLMDYQNPASGLALGLVNAILGPFVALPLSMARCAKMAFEGIGLEWEDFSDWWENTGFADWFDEVKDGFSKDKWTFKGIKEGLSAAWQSAVDTVKEIWNAFAGSLNELLTWEVEPVEVFGKTIFEGTTIDLGKFPMLADGAVIQGGKPFAAILGDQRFGQTNIETPVQTMVDAFKQAFAEVGGAYGGQITVVAQLDGEVLFQETVRQNEIFRKSTGSSAYE